jgi:hypothetical protein
LNLARLSQQLADFNGFISSLYLNKKSSASSQVLKAKKGYQELNASITNGGYLKVTTWNRPQPPFNKDMCSKKVEVEVPDGYELIQNGLQINFVEQSGKWEDKGKSFKSQKRIPGIERVNHEWRVSESNNLEQTTATFQYSRVSITGVERVVRFNAVFTQNTIL